MTRLRAVTSVDPRWRAGHLRTLNPTMAMQSETTRGKIGVNRICVKFSVIVFAIATLMAASAQQSSGGTPPQPADIHNSRNSLDWAGTYEGVLPCADCLGTKTRLTLNHDDSYRLVTQAQGSQNAEKSVSGV